MKRLNRYFNLLAHVKLYHNNPGYTMLSRYLKSVIILNIVIIQHKYPAVPYFSIFNEINTQLCLISAFSLK